MVYESLVSEAEAKSIEVYEVDLKGNLLGLYRDNIVWVKKSITTNTEKACVLAEEIGHHELTVGNIIDQTDVRNRKQELLARQWAYNRLIPLTSIIQAYYAKMKNRYEIATYLGVTEPFLQATLNRYKDKYGLFTVINHHIIYFDPLGVVRMFEENII
ncbi:ImmA/IrrE family metallo-endopeptidase [Paenibacillus sp. NRS-1782]|uniref:ImmA/IrrE family metallo-endopeptidase n=1 Tax=unclassified Paenibacillus TaxID=185978 RepID=UPI003D2D3AD4